MNRKKLWPTIGIIAVSLTLVSIPAPHVALAATGGTFVFGQPAAPSTLDPQQTKENESQRVVVQMYEGLLAMDKTSTKVVPWLAEKYSVSKDGTIWTFDLRRGVKFHDGTPFNAEAVVFNFDRQRLKDNPYHIGEFNVWQTQMGGFPGIVTEVKALDEYTVRIVLQKPMGAFESNLTSPAFLMSSPAAIKADPQNFFKKPVGTGPYKFVEWMPGDRVVMERFTAYWGEKPAFDRIVMRTITNPTARFLELKAGTIHAMDDPNPDDLGLAKADPNLQVLMRDFWPVGTINLNLDLKPFNDVRVRWAIAYAIDREGLMPLYNGLASPGNQAQTPASWAYNPDLPLIAHNPAKAKQLLAEAGYPNGFETDFWYMPVARPYYPAPKEISQKMAADLAAVGIRVNLKTEDWGAYMNNRGGKYPMWMFGGWPSTPDPSYLIYVYYGNKLAQEGNYDNAQVRELMNKAQWMVDQKQRAELYKQAAKITYDEMARVPVVFARASAVVASKKVQGFVTTPWRLEFYKFASFAN